MVLAELGDPRSVAGALELLHRRPQLALGRDPLALVRADHAHAIGLGVLDAARLTDHHS
jgi:hypothetical protein